MTTQAGFDVNVYASSKWYIHQQQSTQYLPAEQKFCVTADYSVKDEKTITGYTVGVTNYAEEQDGTVHSTDSLCAGPEDANDPAKLQVAPCFLPSFAAGPYWVLAYDETEGYALVSGGQPDVETADGCTNGSGVNGSGLWIFTRTRERDDALVAKVRDMAKAQGFDLSVLADVDQTKCK